MRPYSYSELIDSLKAVGIDYGQSVMVHSSLLHLGRMKNVKTSDIAAMHYSALKEVLGSEGTVVVPTFNLEFCDGKAFDPLTTPSVAMGVLSEYVRKLPGAVRSTHPIHSIAAVGPQAKNICEGDSAIAFGPSGPCSKLLHLNARGLLLGTTIENFSMLHFVEEQAKVPYRFTKTYTAPYGHKKELKSYARYIRDPNIAPQINYFKVETILREKKLIQETQVGIGKIQSFDVDHIYSITLERLKKDPFWLVRIED